MKKSISMILLVVTALVLTACGCKHQWQEATCNAPKTCTLCNETEGEPLTHIWNEASCAAPKTCILCNETEGEALAHIWNEATCAAPKTCQTCQYTEGEALPHTWENPNYQDNKICGVCGGTDGKPLTPGFEEHGLEINMEEDVVYEYVTSCYEDKTKKTTALLVVSNHHIFDSDEMHPAKEGYEWHTLEADFTFYDANATKYGWSWKALTLEYYEYLPIDGSGSEVTYTVNYHGQEYSECYGELTEKPQDTLYLPDGRRGATTGFTLDLCVPIGYDGSVLVFYDAAIEMEDGTYLHENVNEDTLYFRLS